MVVSAKRNISVSSDRVAALINTALYPISDPSSERARAIVAEARDSLREHGLASFPDFLTRQALDNAAEAARRAAPQAFTTDAWHNAYQQPGSDDALPPSHARNVRMRTRVASTAYDELPAGRGGLRELYSLDCLARFVAAITQNPAHRLADPLGCCSVNVFRPGYFHAWHFDEAETTVTLCLQEAERGGQFEYSPALRRDASDLALGPVVSIIGAHSEYSVDPAPTPVAEPQVATAPFAPGTLQIFQGRFSLHRVTRVQGERDRLVAVLCFADKPGLVNSPEVQLMFWGRNVSV
jgi:hypothetical protein